MMKSVKFNIAGCLLDKVEKVAQSKKITMEEAVIYLLKKVLAPKFA